MRRLCLSLLLLVSVATAGCPRVDLSESRTSLPAYRCSPAGRYRVPEAIMSCVAANPKPGEIFELDLSPWEYAF